MNEHDELWEAIYQNQHKIADAQSDLQYSIQRMLTRISDLEVENTRHRIRIEQLEEQHED